MRERKKNRIELWLFEFSLESFTLSSGHFTDSLHFNVTHVNAISNKFLLCVGSSVFLFVGTEKVICDC